MVDYCANPHCSKPLLYLREGAVYLFEVTDSDGEASARRTHRLEHYWLCGDCSLTHRLERTANGELRLIPKREQRFVRHPRATTQSLLTAKIA